MKKLFIIAVILLTSQVLCFPQTNIYVEQKTNITITTPQPAFKPTYNTPITPTKGVDDYKDNSRAINPSSSIHKSSNENPFEELHRGENERKLLKIKGKPRYYSKSSINLRQEPGLDSPIINLIEAGEYLFVINSATYEMPIYKPTQGWWYVYYLAGDKYGWVKKTLLIPEPIK